MTIVKGGEDHSSMVVAKGTGRDREASSNKYEQDEG